MNVGGVYTLPIFITCPYTPCRGVYTLAMNIAGLYTLPIFIARSYTPIEGPIPPATNFGVVYILPIFIACPYTLVKGSIPLGMNIGGVYTLAIFIACPYIPCQAVYTRCNEYCTDVHLSTLPPSRLLLDGCRPFQYSSCALVPRVERSIPLAMDVGGVYIVPISTACPYTPCQGVYIPRAECWRSVYPFNIHCLSPYPLSRILYPS